jgi:hypothetical protein
LIPIVAIVTSYLRAVRQAELDASLKQDMLQRGMSAEEIIRVLQARSSRKERNCPHNPVPKETADYGR